MAVSTTTEHLVGYGILAVIGYFGVIQPILQKLGIKDTAQEKKDKKALENYDYGSDANKNPFSQEFNKGVPAGTLLISSATGQNYTDVIREAVNGKAWGLDDDEESVYSVFNRLKTQSQVSSLAYWFSRITNKDLFSFLKSFLDNDQMAIISRIVAGKPKYK